VQLAEFISYRRPALEANEVKYNLILGVLADAVASRLRLWSFGSSGACAVQRPGYSLVLGALSETECHCLAKETQQSDFPGVVGCDDTARWFVEHAAALGLAFREPMPQQIHALSEPPRYPGAAGYARRPSAGEIPLLVDWMIAFHQQALPPAPSREELEQLAGEAFQLLWVVHGEPVSTAGIVRRTRAAAAISRVYTPPPFRGRGYAASVTAAVVERIFAEGRSAACLYTDLRNPSSNRCYARIGFEPVCSSWHFARDRQSEAQ
jgi:RimJ/RimL family protein N-acetyltransferase